MRPGEGEGAEGRGGRRRSRKRREKREKREIDSHFSVILPTKGQFMLLLTVLAPGLSSSAEESGRAENLEH